jgi:hypothetical protein
LIWTSFFSFVNSSAVGKRFFELNGGLWDTAAVRDDLILPTTPAGSTFAELPFWSMGIANFQLLSADGEKKLVNSFAKCRLYR